MKYEKKIRTFSQQIVWLLDNKMWIATVERYKYQVIYIILIPNKCKIKDLIGITEKPGNGDKNS